MKWKWKGSRNGNVWQVGEGKEGKGNSHILECCENTYTSMLDTGRMTTIRKMNNLKFGHTQFCHLANNEHNFNLKIKVRRTDGMRT